MAACDSGVLGLSHDCITQGTLGYNHLHPGILCLRWFTTVLLHGGHHFMHQDKHGMRYRHCPVLELTPFLHKGAPYAGVSQTTHILFSCPSASAQCTLAGEARAA